VALSRSKLYLLLTVLFGVGYIWLFTQMYGKEHQKFTTDVCLFKKVTDVPCPSCGSTRATVSLFEGHFIESILWNPFGIIISLALVIVPIWLVYDFISKKETLYIFYGKFEKAVQNKWIAIPLIILVLLNWIWNIKKGF
jgi:hypothetical protein